MSVSSSEESLDSLDDFIDCSNEHHIIKEYYISEDLKIRVMDAQVYLKQVLSNQIENYSKQRPLNKEHIEKILLPGISKSKKSLGSILIATYNDKSIIMNGQHRTETFKLMKEDELKEIDLILEYRTIKSTKELCKLYNDSNCHMLISVEKLDERHSELMDNLVSEWKEFIRAKRMSVNKIDSRMLLMKIQSTINFDFDKNQVMKILKKLNVQYLEMCYEQASIYSKSLKEEQWIKVVRSKFALGVDTKFTFIDQLRKELISS
jgi:hypothetical protein